jgi:hypothetical protein
VSGLKTGAAAAVTMDVGTTDCVDTGNSDWKCTFTKLYSLDINTVWTPNGTPANGKYSYSSRDRYGASRFTYSGQSVDATVMLSIVKDGAEDLNLTNWFIYGTLYNSKSGSISKTEYF